MRPIVGTVALLLALLGLLAPASAPAGPQQNPAICIQLAHQLVHYDGMRQRAAKMNNSMWVTRFEQQIERLEAQHARHCPEQAAANESAQQLRDLLVLAGRGALTFFTLGAM